MRNYFLMLVIGFLVILGCQDKEYGPVVTDSIPPQPVTIDSIRNIAGGAVVIYSTPDDVDFSYVRATFIRNGKESEARASVYTNRVTIEGLGDTTPREVKLYSVDKSENVSKPVSVTIDPLEPPYLQVFNSVVISPDFGGALFVWENKTHKPVQVELFAADSTHVLRSQKIVPSNMELGVESLRGYDTIPRTFGVLVFDKWENYSPDTVKAELTPWFEEEFDKSEWSFFYLPNDEDWSAWEGKDFNMFDDNILDFCHTWGGGMWPPAFTIDLGGVKKISRMKLWMRLVSNVGNIYKGFWYGHGNPKSWKVFGRSDAPDPATDVQYVDDETWENLGWTLMKDATKTSTDPETFTMIRPTQNGGSAAEDEKQAMDGAEFILDVTNPTVRYVRVIITETWDGANYVCFGELSFFGASAE